jgi:hypothetical protein
VFRKARKAALCIATASAALSLTFTTGDIFAQTDSSQYSPTFADSEAAPALSDNGVSSNKKFDKKDLPRVLEYEKNHKKDLTPIKQLDLPSPSASSSASPSAAILPLTLTSPSPTPAANYFVQPILFVASDLMEDPKNSPAITDTFQLLRRWYSGALEKNNLGYTFRLANVVVFHAPQPFSYYKCPNHETTCDNHDGIWGNVQTELRDAGYPIWGDGISYVVFVKGAGGWAGANCVPNCGTNYPAPGPASTGGFAILGDWALDAISGTVNSDCFNNLGTACYQDPQRGAIGHELGHTFGLAHALDQIGSIMYSWWDFPFTSLLGTSGNDEKSLLRNNSKFFSSQACSPNALINQTILPATVKTKTRFTASFNLTNYGFCHWDTSNIDLRIIRDNVWTTYQQRLLQNVYPAQPYTFSLTLTAPQINVAKKTYYSYWRLRKSGQYFGPQMGSQISVFR